MKRWMGLWVLINLLLLVPVGNHVSAARITGVTETDGCLQTVSVLPDMAVADAWLMAASYDMQNGTLLDVTIEKGVSLSGNGKEQAIQLARPLPKAEGAGIKVFLWDGYTLRPLSTAFEYTDQQAFYVAPGGNDQNPGTLDLPFATLERARDAMRNSNVKVCLLRGGRYELQAPLELTELDGGVTFAAYPGETPVLSGGTYLTGFVSDGNGNYSAPVTGVSPLLELFVGGRRQCPAQKWEIDESDDFRRASWRICQPANGDSRTFTYQGDDIQPGDVSPGAVIEVYDDWSRQFNAIVPIESVDYSSGKVTLGGDAHADISRSGSYRILGNPAFIDQPGEFAVQDGRVVIHPRAEDIAVLTQQGAVVPAAGTLIVADGADNLTFDTLTFADTTWDGGGALTLAYSDFTTVQDCTFQNVGTGLCIQASTYAAVHGNTFLDMGGSAIELSSAERQEAKTHSRYNDICYNTICGTGAWEAHCGGVMLYAGTDNLIAHNDISDCSRYGISMKDTNDNTPIDGNVVQFNRVVRTNRKTGDTGAIELLGRSAQSDQTVSTGNIIRYNWIDDTGGLGGCWTTADRQEVPEYLNDHVYSFGIYLDDYASGVKIYGNFLRNSGNSLIYYHAGRDNEAYNNVMILSNPNYGQYTDAQGKDWYENAFRLENGTFNGPAPDRNASHHNIIYSMQDTNENYVLSMSAGNTNTFDSNLLYRVHRKSTPPADTGSITADPQFRDVAADDFRLRDTSPAFEMGIFDLPYSQMGSGAAIAADFEAGAPEFLTDGGQWSVQDGRYVQNQPGTLALAYCADTMDWSNYRVSADIYGNGGVLFLYRDSDNYYTLRKYDDTKLQLLRVTDGVSETVREIMGTFTAEKLTLAVELTDNRADVWVDGMKKTALTLYPADNVHDAAQWARGAAGVYASYNTPAFDHFTVQ